MSSLFRKPAQHKVGIKFLIFGKEGTGKTVFALSFPKVVAIDAEIGMSFYEGTELGKNLVGIANTQSHKDLEEALQELGDVDTDSTGTLVVDSITKIRENLVQTVTTIDERRARKDGKSADEANTSIRSWGRIAYVMSNLQNRMLDLSAQGVNTVYIAQNKEINERRGDQIVTVGNRPDAQKGMEHDFDVVLQMLTKEGADGKTEYMARVVKDRTGITQKGEIIHSPSYDTWKKAVETLKGDSLDISFTDNSVETEKQYEQSIEDETKTVGERLRDIQQVYKDAKDKDKLKELQEDIKATGISSLDKLTKAQEAKVLKVIEKHTK